MYNEQYNSYYLDSLPYSSYNPNSSYSFRQQSNVYFPSHQHPFPSSTTTQDITSYSNYDPTYLNVAVAAAYQNTDLNFSRHINEQTTEADSSERKIPNKKRKYPDDITSK
jgi:hypothetical protein